MVKKKIKKEKGLCTKLFASSVPRRVHTSGEIRENGIVGATAVAKDAIVGALAQPGTEPRGSSWGIRMTFWYVLWAAILLYIASSGAAAALRIQGGTPLSCCKHGVVRAGDHRLHVVVIVLAHHVHFAQVQKRESPQGGHTRSLVFARNRSPATRGSPVD